MADLPVEKQAKLVQKRLTDNFNEIKAIRESGKAAEEDSEKFPAFIGKYRAVDDLYKNYVNQWDKLYELYVVMDRESDFPFEEKYLKAARTYLYDCHTIYENIVNPIPKAHKGLPLAASTHIDSSASLSQSLSASNMARYRLPKINIPKFEGNLSEWVRFRDVFFSIVHEEESIAPIEKFHHLIGSLSGEPLGIVSAFPISAANYPSAWEALEKRYNNKRILAAAYLHNIKQFKPSSQLSTNPNYLRSFLKMVVDNFTALAHLKISDEADYLKLQLALDCLDSENRQLFEEKQEGKEFPTYKSLVEFIQQRCQILELSDSSTSQLSTRRSKVLTTFEQGRNQISKVQPNSSSLRNCPKCKKGHSLFRCYAFKNLSHDQKLAFIQAHQICSNCLREGHDVVNCPSSYSCYQCKKRHHSLIHEATPTRPSKAHTDAIPTVADSIPLSVQESTPSSGIVGTTEGNTNVLLGTAIVNVLDWMGNPQPVRMVIDSGSQYSIMTEHCANRLGLSVRPSKRILCGVGITRLPTSKGLISCTLVPRKGENKMIQTEVLLMPSLTSNLPTVSLDQSVIEHFKRIELADNRFWESRTVDFLLGSDLFFQIVSAEPRYKVTSTFGTLPTIFGHVVIGIPPLESAQGIDTCLFLIEDSVSQMDIQRFWEVEEVPATYQLHPDDIRCEQHFKENVKRDSDGRYTVALPLRDYTKTFPGSRALAMSRLRSLETKLNKQLTIRENYIEFMSEYLELGHMEETKTESVYVTPHHAVFKETDNEKKIRVVFDASMTTSYGSLNENLFIGPKLQKDISLIIVNFRRHRIALCADMVKMFRQILVKPDHRCYQHILWRFSPEDAVKTYELKTLTYGQASSPYLALRTLKQLVEDEGNIFPKASHVLQNDVYVDDIITGAESIEDAMKLKNELIELLKKGGFPVHKWASNSPELMDTVPKNDDRIRVCLKPESDSSTKVLGIHWDARTDCFSYKVKIDPGKITKRTMLSTLARLFDPLGFLAPITVMAKQMIQRLWLHKLDWDDPPPSLISEDWLRYLEELPSVSDITIPRWTRNSQGRLKIFGFCDASEKAYAATLYLQVVTSMSEVHTFLLAAKTRLAPLKTISIPRLELCSAHLLAKLLRSFTEYFQSAEIESILLFTDSTIVLSWLKIPSQHLKTFVANRIGYILTHTEIQQWHHVPSLQNPADVASRGVQPNQLASCTLWWNGPTWMNKFPVCLPETPDAISDPPDRKIPINTLGVINSYHSFTSELLKRCSKFPFLTRTMAYVLRFINNLKNPKEKRLQSLSAVELKNATLHLIRDTQREDFQEDYDFASRKCSSARFKKLAIFEDSTQVLRVGGRLLHAMLPCESKHPLMLPSKSRLTELIVDHIHTSNFHLGPQALQAYLTREYFIFGLRSLVRKRVWKCIRCFKLKAKPNSPFMGNLPISRVSQGRPFVSVGVDFAGPFSIKQSMRRNPPIGKGYLCLFVCMAVKAVHLEVVSDLTSNAFLAALDRFVARRGLPSDIRSDCGTNFIGAARELKELIKWHNDQEAQEAICRHSSNLGIQWHFNPPGSPHFGGLWEAAVKSAKLHLKRTLGDRPFHFEELCTIFARVEAIMNSRPLCSVTSNPDQYDYLTPGHFLIGSAIIAPPEQDLTEVKMNRQNRWQLLKSSIQIFWKRWASEYIHTLQKRNKWTEPTKPICVNDLVLLQDQNTSPLEWRMARVAELHPGQDGIVRVVTVKTAKGTMKRAVHKLAPLSPINEEH